MRRRHLLEIEDQPWCPAPVRAGITEFLSHMAEVADKPFRAFVLKLGQAMTRAGADQVVELGSGGGGPGITIARLLKEGGLTGVRLVLTDLYPNVPRLALAARRSVVPTTVVEQPVDARAVPAELGGFRIMTNAFHHLPEDIARGVLADAVAKRQGVAVLEFVDRTPGGFLQVFMGIFIMALITPFIRPFRWSRLALTYVVPVIPLASVFDGIVSCLRIYSPDELRALVKSLPDGGASYEWDIGHLRLPFTPVRSTYLVGQPRT